jgi:GNAT superfamily N-acetyltransferase
LILSGLEEHWGFRDPSKNPDLNDIASSYRDGTFAVVCDGPRIVGTGALKPRSATVVEVLRMSVASDLRRRGIGGMILGFLVDQAMRESRQRVILETTETWADVIRFYQKHGFRITHFEAGDVYFALDLVGR